MQANSATRSRANPVAETSSAGEQAILDAAVQLYSKSGYDGVSIRSIAEAAGVSKANIYHHFRSKEALYLAIVKHSSTRLTALLEDLAAAGDFPERVQAFASRHLEHLFDNGTTVRLVLREAFAGDERRSRVLVEQVVGALFRQLTAIFEAGQSAGVVRDDLDPGLCATLLIGGDLFYFQAQGLLRQIPQAGFARQPEQYAQQMSDILLRGMLVADGVGSASR